MSTWDGGSIFGGVSGDDVFGSGGGNVATNSADYSTGNAWADRIFGFGKDIFSDYLDIKKDQWLIDEKTKLALAQNQQAQMLGTVEQPNQVNAQTLEPWQLAALSQSQGTAQNQKMIMFGLIGLGLYLAFK